MLAGRIEERADTAAAAPVSGVAACKKLGCLRVIASPSTSMLGNCRPSAESGAMAAAAARTRHELGPVTILVNNAGISVYESFTDITEDSWDRMIRINLKGPFLVTRELVPDMLRAGWGRIISISPSAADPCVYVSLRDFLSAHAAMEPRMRTESDDSVRAVAQVAQSGRRGAGGRGQPQAGLDQAGGGALGGACSGGWSLAESCCSVQMTFPPDV
ncbi:SDR family NAD(P)-dependent oxidoreductase [Streptomyces mirabilis]|uniref:SDR family NAD(P)-dependent oxidoreductase n=1 Tax=Streptomyces mirabilis TaxID=68239 RepID=UPI0033A22B87